MNNLLFAVVDVETTGGKPHLTRITEIAIYITDGINIIEAYETLINPQRPIDPFVVKLTGITDQMAATAAVFEEVSHKIHDLLQGKIFVAHNVEFDFGMLKKEFFRCGYQLGNSKLCTVKLSKKYFSGYQSYSLGNICKHLLIDNLDRHRAAGDAHATALLFHKIYEVSSLEEIEKELWDGLDVKNLPANISKEQISSLPEAIGVLYLKDESGAILYITACKNIYTTFINILRKGMETDTRKGLVESIKHIDYECFGNYLTASIIRYESLKKFEPKYNKKTGIKNYTHELTLEMDEWGYKQFKINKASETKGEFAVKTTSRKAAERLINQIVKKNNLVSIKEQLGLYKQQHSEEMVKAFNAQFNGIFSKFQFYKPNFVIIGESLHLEACDVFLIENFAYQGMATIHEDILKRNDIEEIRSAVIPAVNNPDITLILKEQLKKSKYLIRYYT